LFFAATPLVFYSCAGQEKMVFLPEPDPVHEQTDILESGEITESQNGTVPLPEWVSRFQRGRFQKSRFQNNGIRQAEAMSAYWGKYIFISANRGTSLSALSQWAAEFTVAQDFPRLVVQRIENRFFAAASLYPDDEYGEFFEAMIKNASNAEYPEAVKEESFWIKWRISGSGENAPNPDETAETENAAPREIYEFLVLISIDKNRLQSRIQELLANTQTGVPPTRDQAVSINRIRQRFFEDF
jgi:hypothetical protein